MTVRALTFSACLLASLTAVSLSAGQDFSAVSIAANRTVTQSFLDWANVNSPVTALLATLGGDSAGWFSSLDDATVAIDGLNRSSRPAGADSDPGAFIGFDADATMLTLGIDCNIDGIYPTSGCAASSPAMDDTCAPGSLIAPTYSPFTFTGNTGTVCTPPIQTTATWVLAGATFDAPFQTVLSVPTATPLIAGTFAATITLAAKLEPDNGYMLGSGVGLILLSVGSRRLFGKRQTK
jgi:hypothetical protein